ncbi:putative uncharacterized protein [Firmicutes bacterium CAG:341]|uniref:hypothetical protein n=1 Tax=Eubacterium sp. TaxID=142586 RepID=UPI00033AB054|nr:putative uncharacterized protein [Firmicutes bacterium CAG:341]
MSIKLSELFGSMDEAFNNQKLEEMFNKTKDVAENMSKKSAERLEISRKKVELLDAKAKLSKLYEKFGKLQYLKYIGEEVSDEEITDCANAIADNKEKIQLYTAEIEKAKAEFNESMANMAKKTKEAFSVDNCTKTEAKADSVEVVEATAVEDENGKE